MIMGFKLVCSCSGCERELNMLGVTASTVPSDGPKPVSKPKRAHRRRLSITIANEDGVITNTIDEKVDDGKHTLQQQSPTLTTKRASIQEPSISYMEVLESKDHSNRKCDMIPVVAQLIRKTARSLRRPSIITDSSSLAAAAAAAAAAASSDSQNTGTSSPPAPTSTSSPSYSSAPANKPSRAKKAEDTYNKIADAYWAKAAELGVSCGVLIGGAMRTLFQRASMEEDVVIFLLFGPIDPDSKVLICVKQGSKASIMGEKLFSHFSKIDPLKNDNASDVEKVTAKVSRSLTLE